MIKLVLEDERNILLTHLRAVSIRSTASSNCMYLLWLTDRGRCRVLSQKRSLPLKNLRQLLENLR
jgi:hypothetical protein